MHQIRYSLLKLHHYYVFFFQNGEERLLKNKSKFTKMRTESVQSKILTLCGN